MLSKNRVAGSRLLEVDYRLYGDAEAALGWLNWRGEVHLRRAAPPAFVLGPLFEQLDRRLSEEGVLIVHLEGLAVAARDWVKASLCANGAAPDVDGDLMAAPSKRHTLTLNLQARGAPASLERALQGALATIPGRVEDLRIACFRPAPTTPEGRMA